MTRNDTNRTFDHVRPAKIQIRPRVRAVWSESSLGASWIAKGAKLLHAETEDWSDCVDAQTDFNLRFVDTRYVFSPYGLYGK